MSAAPNLSRIAYFASFFSQSQAGDAPWKKAKGMDPESAEDSRRPAWGADGGTTGARAL